MAGLAVFLLKASSLVVPACLCGCFMMRWSCVFLLSSCSARGRHLLSLLLGFASVPLPAACPAAGYPSEVTQPFWLQMPVLLLRWSYVCGVCGVFRAALVFSLVPCSACGFGAGSPYRRLPFGVSAFFWPRLPTLLLRWWRRLGCHPSLVFSVLLHRLACRCSLGSATCDRVLPLRL